MKLVQKYQYGSGDYTGECGIVEYDTCEILQFTDYKTMTIIKQIAKFFNGKMFEKENNKQWKRIV